MSARVTSVSLPRVNEKDSAIDGRLVKAVSHPLRVEILGILSRVGARSPKQLSELVGANLGVVSYHVTDVLYQSCQVLELVGTEPRRGAVEHFYAVKPGAFIGAPNLQRSVPKLLRRHIAGAALHTFTEQAVRSLESGVADPDDASLITWMTAEVDRAGQKKISSVIEDALEAVAAIEEECAERIAGDPGRRIRVVFGASTFETDGDLDDLEE